MACTRTEIVTMAKRYLGFNENNGTHKVIIDGYNTITPLPRGYKVSYRDPWCATFISFIAMKCNALDIIPPECSCGRMITADAKLGIYIENDEHHPQLGDIIFYDWDDNGRGDCTGYPDHVGFVSQLTSTGFEVIEGNKGNAVSTRTLGFNARYIRGFSAPKYSAQPTNDTLQPTSVANKSDLDKIAWLVIRGDYGNGDERVSRLTRAGYDPAQVQARVNELVRG